MGAGMGKGQLGGVDDLSAEVDEVDVDRPRSIPDRPNPSEVVLDRMHPTGKIERIEGRLENRNLIEELERGKFGRYVNRLGLNDRTRLHKSRLGQGRKRGNRPLQKVRSRLNIRSERDNRPITWPLGVHP